MKSSTFAAFVISAFALLAGLSGTAHAQATRTWVSGVGDDVNPCSRTAPCKTFAGAISKTAADGEINCLDSGGFGTVTIVKSIVIDCVAGLGGILNAGTNGIVINSATARVTLRNISIDGVGTGVNGISVLNVGSLHVENVFIRGQASHGISFTPAAAANLVVLRSTIREAALHGVLVAPTNAAVATAGIANSNIVNSGRSGVRVLDGGTATIVDAVIHGNATNGVIAESNGASAKIYLERTALTGNSVGLFSNGPGAVVYLSNSLVANNAIGMNPVAGGSSIVSLGGNRAANNAAGDGTVTGTIAPF